MQIQHFEKGIKYNDGEFLLLAKKVGRLATYCRALKDEGSSIRIESERRDTKKNRDQVMVAVTVFLPNKVLRAESLKLSALDGVDRCIEKLEEQIKKYKEMHSGKGKQRVKRKKVRMEE